ncbi:MAG: glycosyltransferase [Epsilonproteobacteria bacterium]|nr:glycosyltransferase [Campylobacterota bacterium]
MIEEHQPLVSIYIPTHNRRKLLERTLKSILNQTYPNIEIIVSDDGSSDETKEFMEAFVKLNSNIKYIRSEIAKGANHARNLALKEASGYYATCFDDDDEMYPTRIEKLVNAYDEDYAFVFAGFETYSKINGKKTNISLKNEYTLNDFLERNHAGNSVLAQKDLFFKAGLYDEKMVACQDYDMWIRMLKIKPLAKAVQKPMCLMYHDHSRITNPYNKIKGSNQWHLKHKKMLSKKRRKLEVISYRLNKGKPISIFDLLVFYPFSRFLHELKKYLTGHYSVVNKKPKGTNNDK